ncbi:hypothetical protein CRENBAI_012304 [Crenichthys baileyi]|uniref:Uncharacterized protein n=1 Tax=Crenichthys baileyi TaxID=28760 RepID=A0AAV9RUJ0_9TELE
MTGHLQEEKPCLTRLLINTIDSINNKVFGILPNMITSSSAALEVSVEPDLCLDCSDPVELSFHQRYFKQEGHLYLRRIFWSKMKTGSSAALGAWSCDPFRSSEP